MKYEGKIVFGSEVRTESKFVHTRSAKWCYKTWGKDLSELSSKQQFSRKKKFALYDYIGTENKGKLLVTTDQENVPMSFIK